MVSRVSFKQNNLDEDKAISFKVWLMVYLTPMYECYKWRDANVIIANIRKIVQHQIAGAVVEVAADRKNVQ